MTVLLVDQLGYEEQEADDRDELDDHFEYNELENYLNERVGVDLQGDGPAQVGGQPGQGKQVGHRIGRRVRGLQ